MIQFRNGDLLQSGCDIIAHQVNSFGVMGGGLALQIANKYPKCEKEYVELCKNHNISDLGGTVQFVCRDGEQEKYIANCFSQDEAFNTNYEWLEACAYKLFIFAKHFGAKTIGIPYKYGCGIAKGNWEKVLSIFKKVASTLGKDEIELQVWSLG